MSEEAAAQLRTDGALAPVVEEYGVVQVEPAEDTFRRVLVSLIRQQVSVEAAAAIRERLFDAIDVTPAGVLTADENQLRDCGLSAAKAEYAKAIARAYEERGYDREFFAGMDDDAVVAELTDIRGVGPWTAKMFLLFCLARPDVFPVEDLGIRRGMEVVCDRELTRAGMRERAEQWAPYRSYASLYLWRAYEG